MEEVGIYRVSGVATDIQALKSAFDTSECRTVNSFMEELLSLRVTARQELLMILLLFGLLSGDCPVLSPCLSSPADHKDVSVMMSEMDVNAIAGTLKLYFRELPEPLFTDELYPNFAGGISE